MAYLISKYPSVFGWQQHSQEYKDVMSEVIAWRIKSNCSTLECQGSPLVLHECHWEK